MLSFPMITIAAINGQQKNNVLYLCHFPFLKKINLIKENDQSNTILFPYYMLIHTHKAHTHTHTYACHNYIIYVYMYVIPGAHEKWAPGYTQLNTFSPLSSVLFPLPPLLPSLGHSFAAGGLLALTHDYRLMKEERGWFSLPEILIKMPFTVPLMEIAKYTHTHT